MRILNIIFLSFLATASLCGESARKWTDRWRPGADDPWLGVRLEWVDRAMAVHLKGIPQGFGLVVDSIEEGGPAQEAGLKELDVIWKFDDQLIANQWQLYSLMKYKGVGTEVKITLTRAGEQMELPLTLRSRPDAEKEEEAQKAVMEIISPPAPDAPLAVKQVFIGRRQAIIEEKGVVVSLSRKRSDFEYIVTEDGKLMDRGVLASEDPATWLEIRDRDLQRKLKVLFESLADAEEREERDDLALRVPRVRRVPSPDEAQLPGPVRPEPDPKRKDSETARQP